MIILIGVCIEFRLSQSLMTRPGVCESRAWVSDEKVYAASSAGLMAQTPSPKLQTPKPRPQP